MATETGEKKRVNVVGKGKIDVALIQGDKKDGTGKWFGVAVNFVHDGKHYNGIVFGNDNAGTFQAS